MLLGTTYVFFTDHANFISTYLENPEYFLNLAHGFITLLSVLCAIYFFLTVLRTLQKPNVYLALSLALLFYGLHPYSFKTLTVWSHTSFNFPLGAGYLILLFTVAHDAQGQISNRLAAGTRTRIRGHDRSNDQFRTLVGDHSSFHFSFKPYKKDTVEKKPDHWEHCRVFMCRRFPGINPSLYSQNAVFLWVYLQPVYSSIAIWHWPRGNTIHLTFME